MPLLAADNLEELTKPVGALVETGDWYVLTERGMFPTVPANKIPWDAWWQVGKNFAVTDVALKFWVADWLRIGYFAFGEKFAQAQELFPWWDEQTLMNIQRVGSRIAPTRRRLSGPVRLPFEYHEAVAACPPEVQDQLLDRAINDPQVTREVLRDMVRSYRQPDPVTAEVEFQAIPIRQAIAAVDRCVPRLKGEPREHIITAGEELHEALRLVEAPRRKAR